MKKIIILLLLVLFSCSYLFSQKQLVLVGTGYGFDASASNGINPGVYSYFQKWAGLTYNGQDASPTAIRLHIQWNQYEPTVGNYQGAKLAQAVAAIIALKPGMKVALHFPYQRPGPQPGQSSEGFLADNEIARISDGTKVEQTITYTIPSMFSASAKTKFFNFVDDALSHLTAYYSSILYVEMGNGDAEEFIMPIFFKNNYHYPAMYEDAALQAWRTEYLPCRYPSQSTVTWGGNTYNIASAPSYDAGQWGDYNSDHGREYHRFASWGLMKTYKQFRDVVKSHSSSIKVLMFEPGFGTTAGNIQSMHNSILPMSLSEFDGIYSTEGGQGDTWRKIMVIDVMKGTNPNKIAGMEFDPDDLGQQQNPKVIGINPNVASEWIPRAYKHGVDYVHLAMSFADSEIDQMAPVIAAIKPIYLNGSYTSPSRQAASPSTTNIFPTSFTGNFLFDNAWNAQSGNNWASTDLSPKSVNMIDNGYWENIWSCSATNPCDYNVTASGPSGSVAGGSSVTLSSTCSGQCSGVSYSWSGNGISGSSANVTFNAPSTAGTYTYTITASKSGCSNKTATVQVVVGAACDFNVTASASPASVNTGAGAQLSYVCSGSNCSGVTYAWSGNGVSGSTSPLSITAPGTAGTYTYTVTASKSSCTNKTANVVLTVTTSGGGGSINQCVEAENSSGNGAITSDPNASNGQTRGEENNNNHYVDYVITSVPSAGNYTATLTYYSSAAPTVGVQINGGSSQTVNLANSNSWNITSTTQSFTVALAAGNNTIRISGTGGGSCRQDKLCVTGSGGGCSAPAAPSLSASPSTINSGSSSTLSASGCSGGTITWSNGLGTGTSKSVSPTSTTTYTATCTIGGCTSSNGSVTVTVNTGGGSYSQCKESESSTGNGAVTSDPNASNGQTRGEENNYNHYVEYALTGVPSAGTYYVTLRYYSSSAPTVGVQVNGGSSQTVNLANSNSWNITPTTQQITVTLAAGSNTVRITGTGGGSCRQDRICVSNTSGSPAVLGIDPAEINVVNINKVMSVSPNPSKGIFEANFYLEKGKKATISVIDMQGRIIYRQSVIGEGSHKQRINISSKASGTLLLQLQKENGVEVKKINIAR